MNTQGDRIKKLALGTVQFGIDYGVSNKLGIVREQEVERILGYAHSLGIAILDTAAEYGSSEEKIGRNVGLGKSDLRIISKIPDVPNPEALEKGIEESLKRLNIEKLYGLLFHDIKTLQNDPELWSSLNSFKNQDLISKAGVSLYFPGDVDWLLSQEIVPDIVQLPFNILDQRFMEYFEKLKSLGAEIHARSVFLQGLFFLDQFDPFFSKVVPKINKVKSLAKQKRIPLEAVLLNFALIQKELDYIIIGVTSKKELERNIDSLAYFDAVQNIADELMALHETDEEMILPFNWKFHDK